MEGIAHQKYVRASAKKLRRFAAPMKGKNVVAAEGILKLSPSPSAEHIAKAIHSAASNLKNKMGVDAPEFENMIVSEIRVDNAPAWKRLKLRSRGKADLMLKRNAHIIVKVIESLESIKAKPKQSQATTKSITPALDKPKIEKPVDKPSKETTVKEKPVTAAPKPKKEKEVKKAEVKKADTTSPVTPQKRKFFRTPKGK